MISKKNIQAWRDKIGHEEADKISHRAARRGTNVHGVIEKYLPKQVTGTINEAFQKYGKPTCDIFLAIGIIKRARMKLAIKKTTECGVRTIKAVPIERSIKPSINYERVNKIIKSETKQCGRSKFPVL